MLLYCLMYVDSKYTVQLTQETGHQLYAHKKRKKAQKQHLQCT